MHYNCFKHYYIYWLSAAIIYCRINRSIVHPSTKYIRIYAMNRYQLQEEIGDGSFGRVIKAQNKKTGEIVAVKHIKNKFKVSTEGCN